MITPKSRADSPDCCCGIDEFVAGDSKNKQGRYEEVTKEATACGSQVLMEMGCRCENGHRGLTVDCLLLTGPLSFPPEQLVLSPWVKWRLVFCSKRRHVGHLCPVKNHNQGNVSKCFTLSKVQPHGNWGFPDHPPWESAMVQSMRESVAVGIIKTVNKKADGGSKVKMSVQKAQTLKEHSVSHLPPSPMAAGELTWSSAVFQHHRQVRLVYCRTTDDTARQTNESPQDTPHVPLTLLTFREFDYI
ncbi:hypothetical protein HPG69_009340 [Diceros bicornis minor]|uniref:Uncharacterized protein n=1 Tax=Diceros bicornis minor TaxID=77932 RepID=A0A7J7EYK7_DICBM|nr:hypothetical protein HPG69_009340 [Diceros bicornis minor]